MMQTVELETYIQTGGQIVLPESCKNWFGKTARIILLHCAESTPIDDTPFDIYAQLDLGDGGYAQACSSQAKQAMVGILQQKINK